MPRLDITRTDFELAIDYRWRNPLAYFLVIFCLFWDGFLIFWYGIGAVTGEMPAMFFLFPLIHVAVGVALTYYTVCLFVNTTQIRVDRRRLSVSHGPLPWPRGNQDLSVRDLAQVYVKVKTSSKGQSTSLLKARLHKGDDLTLLPSVNAPTETLLELERAIEDYLGISDAPVSGEMTDLLKPGGGRPADDHSSTPRRPPGYAGELSVERAEVGDFITYAGRTFEVTHAERYAWNDGNTDRQLQLSAVDGQPALLYVLQDKGIYRLFLEIAFTRAQQLALAFEPTPTPAAITYQDVTYELYRQQAGRFHVPERVDPLSATQWIYRTPDGEEHLRILDHQGMEAVYFGQAEIAAAFDLLTP